MNDLWHFNPNSLNWTWMGGATTLGSVCPNGYCGQPANYGVLGTAAAGNTPGGREFAEAGLTMLEISGCLAAEIITLHFITIYGNINRLQLASASNHTGL